MIAPGVDCGTRGLETVAPDNDSGEILASAAREFESRHPLAFLPVYCRGVGVGTGGAGGKSRCTALRSR